jgi:predicted RNase H-like nuclease (RuvC/YqgF family)
MPSKNNKVKDTAKVEETTSKKATKKVAEESDDDDEIVVQQTQSPSKSKAKVTKKALVEESESEEVEVQAEAESEDESDDESEDEVDAADSKEKKKEKKQKESFEDLTKRIDTHRTEMKTIDKEISELEKTLKTKEKERNEHERQLNNAIKLLSKTHSDEVTKALKERPKRKGNVNGGFNKEQPVPEVLRSFLGLADGAAMARPKVMSALNNKFTELKLKDGQNTTLDKPTAKALGLGKTGEGKVIKFTEFQTFLASFYPKAGETEVNI